MKTLVLVTALLGLASSHSERDVSQVCNSIDECKQHQEKQCFRMNLDQARNQLSDTNSFQIFDVLSQEEIQMLDTMKIEFESNPQRYFFNDCKKENFEGFLQSGGNSQQAQEIIAPILQKVCSNLSNMLGAIILNYNPIAIIVDRKRKLSARYWHIDHPSRDDKDETTFFRVIVDLQGEGTLFAEYNIDQAVKFNENPFCREVEKGDVRQLKSGQAVVFDTSKALHSPPEIIAPRALMILDFVSTNKS
jgi:hypothetical protein